MNIEFVKTTYGEWSEDHCAIGRTLIWCSKCEWVMLPKGVRVLDCKECPVCKKKFSESP